jgi:hypothetical protein
MTPEDDNSDFDLHGLVERRPLDALELIAEKVDEFSKLLAELEQRVAKIESERHHTP